ncbi:MAG: FKBP-type peptidyl-prolyl cis-trans isomerase [Patescibacteria group bacterium]
MWLENLRVSNKSYTSQTVGIVFGALVGLAVLVGIYFIFIKNSNRIEVFNNNEEIIFRDNIAGTNKQSQNPMNKSSENTQNQTLPNSQTTPSQNLIMEIIKSGEGAEAKTGDRVTVNYTGWLSDGTKFDSSLDRGEPFSFSLGAGQVIIGWDQGVVGMKIGEQRKLIIPPQLAYGDQGAGNGVIPVKATLIFEIELLQIN